ncbi:MAG: lysylphosphatidylglycerol synthase transmembrane domain-containing protein [Nanoarchaeota archaeon]
MKRDYSKMINYTLLILGAIILVVFVKTLDFAAGIKSMQIAGLKVIFFMFILMIITVVIKAFRWQILVKKITGKSVSLWFSFLSIFAGVSSGSIFPGRNEITKPLMLKTTYNAKLSNSIPAALIEKIFDFVGIIVLFFIALLFIQHITLEYNQYIMPIVILGIVLLFSLFVFPKKVAKILSFIIFKLPVSNKLRSKINRFNEIFFKSFDVLKDKKATFLFFSLTFIEVFVEVIRLYYLFMALGTPISLVTAAIASSGATLIGLISLIPGGVGIVEFSEAYIIKAVSNNSELNKIKTLVFIDRIISYFMVIAIGALVLLFYQKIFKKQIIKKGGSI